MTTFFTRTILSCHFVDLPSVAKSHLSLSLKNHMIQDPTEAKQNTCRPTQAGYVTIFDTFIYYGFKLQHTYGAFTWYLQQSNTQLIVNIQPRYLSFEIAYHLFNSNTLRLLQQQLVKYKLRKNLAIENQKVSFGHSLESNNPKNL